MTCDHFQIKRYDSEIRYNHNESENTGQRHLMFCCTMIVCPAGLCKFIQNSFIKQDLHSLRVADTCKLIRMLSSGRIHADEPFVGDRKHDCAQHAYQQSYTLRQHAT